MQNTNGLTLNRSSLIRRKGKCSICVKVGDIPTDNHRAGSSKCPSRGSIVPASLLPMAENVAQDRLDALAAIIAEEARITSLLVE